MRTNPLESQKDYQGDPNHTLYITNLDPKVGEKDLANFFSKFGCPTVVKIVRDWVSKKSLSYGFIEFSKASDAFTARYQSQYQKLERREILVMFISERNQLIPEAKIFVKNIPTHISLQQVHDKFREVSANVFVHINTDEKGKRLDFGFVHYKAKEDAELALKAFKDLELGGQKLQLSRWVGKETRQACQKESRKNLYLRNLPLIKKKTIERSLTILLLPFGEIESMLVKKAPSFDVNYALVSFKSAESAQRALKEISERPTYLEGSKEPLSISWYQRRTERENVKDHEMNAIFVENLKMSSHPGMVKDTLMRYGPIKMVNLCSGEAVENKGMTRCGHVVFEFASSAEAAFNECKLSSEFQNLFVGEAEVSLTHYSLVYKKKSKQMKKQDRSFPQRRKSSFNSDHQEVVIPQESPINNPPPMPQQQQQAVMAPYYTNMPNMYYPYYPMGYYYPMATPYGYPPMYNPSMYNMMMDQQNSQNMKMNNSHEEADEKKRNSYKKGSRKSGPSSVGSLSTLDDCHVEDSETPELSAAENNSTASDSLEIDPRDWKDDKKSTSFTKGSRANGMWKAKRKYGNKKPKVVELVENAE